MLHLIYTAIIGLVVGTIAKLLMPGRDPGGFIITALLGVAGSVVAGYLGRALHLYQPGQPVGFIASIVGAIILLIAYRVLFGSADSSD
ncbi:GlsB/YeaQ/YmgE family stress response membrane protein [Swingsia samuiensis]|uniref:GlsB/YeaQ/YmgE family stress response membrane protein n=1 Tax=Swingsia samuiensis TaxID=1293412 RepID=A0A4Y6UIR1_9PROT|nr:GlsB/YeaQ/YmgE family stress response membrane protein [Swingsia samuiensis]QDH16710.1 GlsB/YeaQ/YmgE family stress response membrane protein [Swingsia samuiensis]